MADAKTHIFTPLNEIYNYYQPKCFLSPNPKHGKYVLLFQLSPPSLAGLSSKKLENVFIFLLYLRILALETILPNSHFAYEKIETQGH